MKKVENRQIIFPAAQQSIDSAVQMLYVKYTSFSSVKSNQSFVSVCDAACQKFTLNADKFTMHKNTTYQKCTCLTSLATSSKECPSTGMKVTNIKNAPRQK